LRLLAYSYVWENSKLKPRKRGPKLHHTFAKLAEQLDGEGAVTLELGGKQVQLDPTDPDPVTFKLEGESDWSEGDTEAKQSIEFELVWWCEAQTAEEGALDITTEGQ